MTTVKTLPIPGQRSAPATGPLTEDPLRITCMPGIPRRPTKKDTDEEPDPDGEPHPDEEPDED